MKELVIGLGEVGLSLQRVLQCRGHDLEPFIGENFEILHICIPWSSKFIEIVQSYQERYSPKITIIHSTIPVGTSRKLNAVHSPIHGIHPNLEIAIRTFIKYIGAVNREDAEFVLRLYSSHGIKGYIVKNPETSELSKLGCTTRHGLMIIEEKLFKKKCDELNVDFEEAYTLWNGFYTDGYRILGLPYVQRAIIKDQPGKIGGHCLLPNAKLIETSVGDFIINQNEKL